VTQARQVKVVFIASASRSGSTLLDVSLGSRPGFFSAGEVRFIWQRGFMRGEPCGCGVPVAECDFWTEVVSDALGGIAPENIASIARLQERVDHPDRFIRSRFFSPLRFLKSYREDAARYLDIMARVYAGIARVSGCDYIIDSSKAPPHGFLLRRIPGITTHNVHLVRDSRAVVYSMESRRAVVSNDAHLNTYGPYKAALRWHVINRVYHRLDGAHGYTRIRYEDFAKDPGATLDQLSRSIGNPLSDLSFIHDGGIDLAANHTVSGNPMRFRTGSVQIRPDIRWTTAMNPARRHMVTALTAPLLFRYGYL